MSALELTTALLIVAGVFLSFARRDGGVAISAAPRPSGINYLRAFALLVLIFAGITVAFYWGQLRSRREDVLFAGWLLLVMVAGMFAQVMAENYRSRKRLFDIPRDRLLYPLLFSVIVFYPIWALASSSEPNFFVVQAAFLNGYFWESIVSAARPPPGKS